MKALIFLSLLSINIMLNAQTCIGYAPQVNNVSMLHNQSFKDLGVYSKIRVGKMQVPEHICNETVISLGLSYRIGWVKVMAGSSYNHYYNIKDSYNHINISKFKKLSIDFGFLAQIPGTEKLYVFAYDDVLNWIGEFGFGIKF